MFPFFCMVLFPSLCWELIFFVVYRSSVVPIFILLSLRALHYVPNAGPAAHHPSAGSELRRIYDDVDNDDNDNDDHAVAANGAKEGWLD